MSAGTIYYFENQGSKTSLFKTDRKFTKSELVMTDNKFDSLSILTIIDGKLTVVQNDVLVTLSN